MQQLNYEKWISTIENFDNRYKENIDETQCFGFPTKSILEIENRLLDPQDETTAYLSMEYGLAPSIYNSFKLNAPISQRNQFFTHEVFSNYWLCDYLFKVKIDKMLDIPIYGGGLGVLAGDTVKSIADLGLNVAAVGILWNKGYFKQKFWYKHGQMPDELSWDPNTYPGLIPLKDRISIQTKEGLLSLRLWKYYVYSYHKKSVCPLILLDTNIEENNVEFRKLTDQLYRSDDVKWKIYQRLILGVGAIKALKQLNYSIERHHLNEGHAAFALVEKYLSLDSKVEIAKQKNKFAYTCHTPVAAGHDRFSIEDLRKVLTDEYVDMAASFGKETKDSEQINLTYMCLNSCNKVNGVAQKHGEITRLQFPQFAKKIDSITNGIHLHTWLSESYAALFDKYKDVLGDWRENQEGLIQVAQLKDNEEFRSDIFQAHLKNKQILVQILSRWGLKDDVLTIGWARRIAGYKRPALIFHQIEKIIKMAYELGPIQIILAGKAHPNDNIGSAHIEEILDHIDQLNEHRKVIKVLILENYDTYFGKLLTSSVDVWLNNPLPPFEASGTSGMKAIANGVLQVSTLDGWVVEAADDDIGWIFGYQHSGNEVGDESQLRLDEDAEALCVTLEEVIRLYRETHNDGVVNIKSAWIDKMIHCIERSAFFNTNRMVKQYKNEMWLSPQNQEVKV